MNQEQLEDIFFTALVGRLLGWAGGILSGVGMTLTVSQGSSALIGHALTVLVGVFLCWLHQQIAKANLRTAINLPPPLPVAPPLSSASTQTPIIPLKP